MNPPLDMGQEVAIRLTVAEALTLSDCLDRLNHDESLSHLIDKAEQTALWALDSKLECWNPVIFSTDYKSHLQKAKTFLTRGMDE